MSDGRAQPIHFKNLQKGLGHLWKGHVATESPGNHTKSDYRSSPCLSSKRGLDLIWRGSALVCPST